MKRSPMYTGVAFALGLTLALTLLWLLGGHLPAARAAPPARPLADTIIVTTTIQAAVDAAANGDTISIPAGTYTENVNISGKVLTFIGAGAASTIVDGSSAADRVFNSDSDITLADLTIQNGNVSGDGGGLYTSGALTLTNVAVLSNTATSGGGGARADGAVTLSGGLFQNNRSTSGDGGGLLTSSTLSLTGTQFLSNTAQARGGGVYASGTATLTNPVFKNNTAGSAGGGVSLAQIGSTMTLTGGVFERNTANLGGGVYASGPLNLSRTAFYSNTAGDRGGGVWHGCNGCGGAGRLVNVLFAGNAAGNNGGATYFWTVDTVELLHTTVASPTVGAGNAIYVNAGTVNITNTIVSRYTTGIQVGGGEFGLQLVLQCAHQRHHRQSQYHRHGPAVRQSGGRQLSPAVGQPGD
jgi:predicted outer membrane repeat protein